MWSFRESPLVDGDKVICTPGGEEATMVALNKLTGETIWKSQVPDRAGGGQFQTGLWRQSPSVCRPIPCSRLSIKIRTRKSQPRKSRLRRQPLKTLDKNQDGKISEDEVSPKGETARARESPRPEEARA
jgi:hypothetical protein